MGVCGVCGFVYLCARERVCKVWYICKYMYIYVRMNIHMYTYICICIYMYVYTTYMYLQLQVSEALSHTSEFSSEEMSFLQRYTNLTGLPSLCRCVWLFERREDGVGRNRGAKDAPHSHTHVHAQCLLLSLSHSLSLTHIRTPALYAESTPFFWEIQHVHQRENSTSW